MVHKLFKLYCPHCKKDLTDEDWIDDETDAPASYADAIVNVSYSYGLSARVNKNGVMEIDKESGHYNKDEPDGYDCPVCGKRIANKESDLKKLYE